MSIPKCHQRMVVSLVAVACVTSACSFGGSDEASGPDQGDTLVVGVSSLGSEDWSPWLASQDEEIVTQHVFDTLVRVDPNSGELVPGLAESWELSGDLLTWTFQLRPDVPFHGADYGTVTAEDVRFSWEQLIRDDSLMAQAPLLRQAIGDDMANFEVLDELSFRVTGVDPLPTLATQLTDQGAGLLIQSALYWDEMGDAAAEAPVGTGPFEFVESTPGVGATLQPVDSHPFREVSEFDTVELRIIQDNATRLAAVQSGEVDLAAITPQQVAEAESGGTEIRVIEDVGLVNVIYGGMYPDHENYDTDAPWIQADNPEQGQAIREALSVAIDRPTIIERINGAEGELAPCPLVCYPGMPWTDTSIPVPEYDPDRARELLVEGGFPDGFPLNVWIFEQSGRPGTADAIEAIAGMWEEIGINVTREPIDFPNFLTNIQDRTTGGYAWMYITPFYADPAVGVQVAYAPTSTRAHFNDPAINSALEALSVEPDTESRYEIIEAMSRQLAESVSAAPLFTQVVPYAAGPDIGDWVPIPGVAKVSGLETVTAAG